MHTLKGLFHQNSRKQIFLLCHLFGLFFGFVCLQHLKFICLNVSLLPWIQFTLSHLSLDLENIITKWSLKGRVSEFILQHSVPNFHEDVSHSRIHTLRIWSIMLLSWIAQNCTVYFSIHTSETNISNPRHV